MLSTMEAHDDHLPYLVLMAAECGLLLGILKNGPDTLVEDGLHLTPLALESLGGPRLANLLHPSAATPTLIHSLLDRGPIDRFNKLFLLGPTVAVMAAGSPGICS